MTHEERNAAAAIICNLLITLYFIMRLWSLSADGRLDGPDALMIWARSVIWTIAAGIVLTIIVTIVFNILHAIATNEARPSFVVDERDRMISIRGMKVTMIFTSSGFILSVVALAAGWPILTVLNMILAAFATGTLLGDLARLCLYRKAG